MESRKHKVLTEREVIFNDWQAKAKELGIDFTRAIGKEPAAKRRK